MGESNNNLSIIGESAIKGGSFMKVNVIGNLKASELVEAKRIRIVGNMDSNGDLSCEEIFVLGVASVNKLSVSKEAKVNGQLFSSDIIAEKFLLKGEVKCQHDVECTEMEVRGVINVGNLLSAEKLDIKTNHLCEVKELGGKTIKVRNSHNSAKTILRAVSMEFDDIDADNIDVQVIRAKNAVIGKDCTIGTIEYSGTLSRHPAARIERIINTSEKQKVQL